MIKLRRGADEGSEAGTDEMADRGGVVFLEVTGGAQRRGAASVVSQKHLYRPDQTYLRPRYGLWNDEAYSG